MSNLVETLKEKAAKPTTFPAMLESWKSEIARALPRHLNAERISRVALTAFRRNPKLAECDPRSIFGALIQAAQLGLEIDTLGRAYLIPYKVSKKVGVAWQSHMECQFVPGWKGLVELMNRSGQGTAWTGAVYDGDTFDFSLGDSPRVNHIPAGEYGADKLLYVYAIGRPKGSDWPVIEVWTMARVTAHRDKYNKVGDKHYSHENMEMYGRKVVLLQVLKYMPSSPELATATELAHAAESPGGQGLTIEAAIDGSWVPPPEAETDTQAQGHIQGPSEWPRKNGLGQNWLDSEGAIYNADVHGWNAADARPSVTSNGVFRRRRVAGAPTPLDEWPKKTPDGPDGSICWVDSTGETFDTNKHIWHATNKKPSVNAFGEFLTQNMS